MDALSFDQHPGLLRRFRRSPLHRRAGGREADLSGANLVGARLVGVDIEDADLSAADLRTAEDLTQEQLEETRGSVKTILPDGLRHPKRWAN